MIAPHRVENKPELWIPGTNPFSGLLRSRSRWLRCWLPLRPRTAPAAAAETPSAVAAAACDGEGFFRDQQRTIPRSTRSCPWIIGKLSRNLDPCAFPLSSSFLKHGCVIQDNWKSRHRRLTPAHPFPRFPHPRRKPLWIPSRDCGERGLLRYPCGPLAHRFSTPDRSSTPSTTARVVCGKPRRNASFRRAVSFPFLQTCVKNRLLRPHSSLTASTLKK